MAKKKEDLRFEEKLEALEKLTLEMEEGNLSLDALLAVYEKGVLLSKELKVDLEVAQQRLMVLKNGKLSPAEEA